MSRIYTRIRPTQGWVNSFLAFLGQVYIGVNIHYARGLLLAFASLKREQQAALHASSALLLEPLTEAELRVLGLLARGRTNPEIAATQVVSINTVKTQVQSIYRKLGVKSRWEASEAAHRLDLL